MSQSPIFLTPVFQNRIWGGTALKDAFSYNIPSETTGVCWAVSAHPNGQSIVASGKFQGKTLGQLWEKHRELFGELEENAFPLLTKILDVNKNLSVQVNPDDEYANQHENGELGKTGGWYIIDCKKGAEIIFGHNASTKDELANMIAEGKWNELLRRVKIQPGDFFYVPSGTIHALCEGTLVLETQQSTDTTYKVYDYDRRADRSNQRELHLKKAIEVTKIPHKADKVEPSRIEIPNLIITTFVETEYFSVYKWEVKGEAGLIQEQPFLILSVIRGEGTLQHEDSTYTITKGSHFILPADTGEFVLSGEVDLIVSHI
ncbi:mannose-6-phosphate isomerase, class I [Bacillus lacus]|uniref:Mannose-6-phosphate isomerase n=1 Tax=Metabacillus lacus TaxID=1983721 RepID=A0A7X2M0G4_9BACI|nr:mannose-6-phosphate isomerase, class I [Metabacillus lacus]MRX72814.1 mannose-6-phosphate isomerase, class I [Metabacillus lacus]